MNANQIKKNLLVCLLLICSTVAAAAASNIWKIEAMSLKPGVKSVIDLKLENADAITSFQMDVTLPDGILLAGVPTLAAQRMDGHQLSWNGKNNNTYRCVVYSLGNNNVKGDSGVLLSIPIQVSNGFKEGRVSFSQMVMSNKKSEKVEGTTDLGVFTREVERKNIVLNVAGLEQVVNENKAAEITLTTLPADLRPAVKIEYYKDERCEKSANESDRKLMGTFYVKLSRTEDEEYNAIEVIYMLVVNNKREVQLTAPEASSIVEGQPLFASILTKGSATWENNPVPGFFIWTNSDIMTMHTGSYNAIFIPDDIMNYSSKEVPVQVEVIPTHFISVVNPTNGGTIQVEGRASNDTYTKGQKLTLTAFPDANYQLKEWTGLVDASMATTQSITITIADKDVTISANFEPIMHSVIVNTTGSGNLIIKDEKGKSIQSGDKLQQGAVLTIIPQPNEGMRVTDLKVADLPFAAGKYKLDKEIKISASFAAIPAEMFLVTTENSPNGSIRLYTDEGTAIASGSSLKEGSLFTVVTLPNSGYTAGAPVVKSNGQVVTPSSGKYVVLGSMSVSATFSEKVYQVSVQYEGSGKEVGKLVVTPEGASHRYGTFVTIKEAQENGTTLSRIIANGKEVYVGETLSVISDMTITAVFDKKVDIKPEYIIQTPQRYVYNGISRNFVAYATQTYACFSFDVKYKKAGTNTELDKAVDAGNYHVIVRRNTDNLYTQFEHTFSDRLIIDKSRIAVMKAPTASDNGVTRPSEGVGVKRTSESDRTKLSYTPIVGSMTENNYMGTNYYLSTNTKTWVLPIGGTTVLRSSEEGYVRVTNGNLPYTEEELKNIPEGTIVSVEAVPNHGYKFKQWEDGTTVNPREITVGTGMPNLIPAFMDKQSLNPKLAQETSVYTGEIQMVRLTNISSVNDCRISFYSDEERNIPVELKECGTYYLRVYRPEDPTYLELDNKELSYIITKADIAKITPPTASDVIIGEKLSQAQLCGGNAGSIPGRFEWVDESKEVRNESDSFEAKFIPSNPNYNEKTVSVSVKGIPTTKSSTGETPGTDPTDPVDPNNPDNPDTPDITIDAPTVLEREAESAVICWVKVENAVSYRVNLYNDKSKTVLIKSFEFDNDGKLRSDAITLQLTDLEANKAYYVEAIAYDVMGKELAKKGTDLPADIATQIEEIANKTKIVVDNKMLHIYPSEEVSLSVININGVFIFRQTCVTDRIDVPVHQAGVYLVAFRSNGKQSIRKVIVY